MIASMIQYYAILAVDKAYGNKTILYIKSLMHKWIKLFIMLHTYATYSEAPQ